MEIPALEINLAPETKELILKKMKSILDDKIKWTNAATVSEFENAFSEFTGTRYSVAMNTGSTALEAVLIALDISRESIIFVPTMTAPPTVYCAVNTGAKSLLVDCNRNDMGMDPVDLERKIRQYESVKSKVIVPVHIGGYISGVFNDILAIGRKYNIPVVEDCAHAHGTRFHNRHTGLYGVAGAFSFFLTKVLTSGEGGIVITDDAAIAEKLKIIRNYGKDKTGMHVCKGSSWRMNEFTAAVALYQTVDARDNLKSRRQIAGLYDDLLAGIKGISPLMPCRGNEFSYYKYVAVLDENTNAQKLKHFLKENFNIVLPAEVYKNPCHTQPYIQTRQEEILNINEAFPDADYMADHHICLPIFPGFTEKQVYYLVDAIKKYQG